MWKKKKQFSPLSAFDGTSDATKWVEEALAFFVPDGWKWRRSDEGDLQWLIEKKVYDSGEWPVKDYKLMLLANFSFFVVTYGNNDLGCGTKYQNARVYYARNEIVDGMKSFFGEVFELEPNEWGYS